MADLNPKKTLEQLKHKLSVEEYVEIKSAIESQILEKPRKQLSKIPLLLPLIASFGLAATFYGFEKLLDRTTLVDHPLLAITVGVILLLITGAAATKL